MKRKPAKETGKPGLRSRYGYRNWSEAQAGPARLPANQQVESDPAADGRIMAGPGFTCKGDSRSAPAAISLRHPPGLATEHGAVTHPRRREDSPPGPHSPQVARHLQIHRRTKKAGSQVGQPAAVSRFAGLFFMETPSLAVDQPAA
ncbi:MAG: hypothetical protein KDA79_08995 [Planctomycetaceae bacterium]|nr:hypothetical protein [Planctomycetaceae bacterium]